LSLGERIENLFWQEGGNFSPKDHGPLFRQLGERLIGKGVVRQEFGKEPHKECRTGKVLAAEAKALESAFGENGKEKVRELVLSVLPGVIRQPGSEVEVDEEIAIEFAKKKLSDWQGKGEYDFGAKKSYEEWQKKLVWRIEAIVSFAYFVVRIASLPDDTREFVLARNLANAPFRLKKGMERRLDKINVGDLSNWDKDYLKKVIPDAERSDLGDKELLEKFKSLRKESGTADLSPIRHLPPGTLSGIVSWLEERES